LRKNKALYVLDNGIANALLRLSELNDTQIGHIVESVCVRDALSVCEINLWGLHFWREKTVEVDIVIGQKISVLPIEIKYRNTANKTSLLDFKQKFPDAKIPVSIVITKDQLDRKEDILYVPFWMVR